MATVTSLGSVFSTAAGNKTLAGSVSVGDLIVVIAANSGRTTAQSPTITDNNTGGAGAYSLVRSATGQSSVDSMWLFVRTSLCIATASTTVTMATASDTGGGFQYWKVSGMSIVGASAFRQTGTQDNQAAATPGPAFPVAALTANACVGAVLNATNTATLTQPTGWTEAQDVGYNSPPTGLETAHRSSGVTLTTVTWGSASGSAFCSLIGELDTSVPFVKTAPDFGHPGFGVAPKLAAIW